MPRTLHETRYLRLVESEGWVYAERANATGVVVLVALTNEGELLLTEQFRRPVDRRVIELPAGLVGDEVGASDEEMSAAAHRELIEETGYRAARLRRVAHGPATAGLSSEILTFFLAEKLTLVGEGGGVEGEDIVVHRIPVAKAAAWLSRKQKSGTLVDPKVYAGLWFVRDRI